MLWVITMTTGQGVIFIIVMHAPSVDNKYKLWEHNNNFLSYTPFHPLHCTFKCRGERGKEREGGRKKERERESQRGGREKEKKEIPQVKWSETGWLWECPLSIQPNTRNWTWTKELLQHFTAPITPTLPCIHIVSETPSRTFKAADYQSSWQYWYYYSFLLARLACLYTQNLSRHGHDIHTNVIIISSVPSIISPPMHAHYMKRS